jgi:hypothetical protein
VGAGLRASVLADRLRVDEGTVLRRLGRLGRLGYVQPRGSGWSRAAELLPVGRLYALEAKVEDWRGALRQALMYATWADAAGVVLLQLPRDTTTLVQEARRLEIGLAHNERWLVRPRIHRHPLARRLLASEHLVAAMWPHLAGQ